MGKGIALQFKQAFPENFRQYHRACLNKSIKLGSMFIVPTGIQRPKYIINFPTKQHWKEKSRLIDIESGLKSMVTEIKRLGIKSIAIPALGCGNGGLDWRAVEPLIQHAVSLLPNVAVQVYPPQQAPHPASIPIRTVKPTITRARAALLVLLNTYQIEGYKHSLLEIQKLAYFLQFAGEPLRLEFVADRFGPYAEKLNFVLQAIDGHFISGYGDRTRAAEIRLLPGSVDAARTFLAQFDDANQHVQRAATLIEGFETPYGVELLSTAHWVAKETPLAALDVEIAIASFRAWNSRKRDLFKPDHIKVAWSRLKNQGWI